MKHPVRVLPHDVELLVDHDSEIYFAATDAGWNWPTVCTGCCECGQCWMLVEEGAQNLTPMEPEERARLDEGMAANRPNARLACMAGVRGPVVVSCRRAKPPE